jgi:hypothetical protein
MSDDATKNILVGAGVLTLALTGVYVIGYTIAKKKEKKKQAMMLASFLHDKELETNILVKDTEEVINRLKQKANDFEKYKEQYTISQEKLTEYKKQLAIEKSKATKATNKLAEVEAKFAGELTV